jgi:8-oxo-dGTP pyrophosphatase MutT (NUDIX family)
MRLSVMIRRPAYRLAYLLLRTYWFLAGPDVSGVKCVLTDRGRVLLVRHTYGPRSWDLPGGSLKRREQPLECARREMSEELGVRIEDWSELGDVVGRQYRRHDTLHCFQAELRDPELTLDLGELAAAQWFDRNRTPAPLGAYVPRILARLQ